MSDNLMGNAERTAKQAVVDDAAFTAKDPPQHVMHTLDKDGDQRVQWDRRNEDEVSAARITFDTLKRKGYLAYKATEGGGRGEQIRTFDPAAEHIILVKQLQGG